MMKKKKSKERERGGGQGERTKGKKEDERLTCGSTSGLSIWLKYGFM